MGRPRGGPLLFRPACKDLIMPYEIIIDPVGDAFVLRFRTFDERADFLEKYVPPGRMFAQARCGGEEGNYRLSWALRDIWAPFTLPLSTP